MKEELKNKGWKEPLDKSIIETPSGWYGGEVWHSGGNIWVRTWRNVEDNKNTSRDEYLEVGYNDSFDGVSIDKYVKDEERDTFYHKKVVDSISVKDGGDKECAEAALKLMKKHN